MHNITINGNTYAISASILRVNFLVTFALSSTTSDNAPDKTLYNTEDMTDPIIVP